METESIDYTLVEALNKNAEAAEKEATILTAIAKRTAEVAKAATDGDVDEAIKIIAEHDRDYSTHPLIATTQLHSNEIFLTTLVKNVFPEAENIETYTNGVAFSWRGYEADFRYAHILVLISKLQSALFPAIPTPSKALPKCFRTSITMSWRPTTRR